MDELRRLVAVTFSAPGIILIVDGFLDYSKTATFTFMPNPHGYVSVLLAVVIPLILAFITVLTRFQSKKAICLTTLSLAFFSPVLTCIAAVLGNDANLSNITFYFISAVCIAYLWRGFLPIAQTGLCITLALLQFVLTDSLPVAITKWLAVAIVLIGTTYALVRSNIKQAVAERALTEIIHRDALTGLGSRPLLQQQAGEHFTDAPTDVGHAVITVDIDRFKVINDKNGHPIGDLVLQLVGAVLLRNSHPDTIPCRLGGDEFAILLPNTSALRAKEIAQHITEDAGRLSIPDTPLGPGSIQLSVGTSHLLHSHDWLGDLYVASDRDLYRVKQLRRKERAATHNLADAPVGRLINE